jgi:superfamily II DNA or RNA helicase
MIMADKERAILQGGLFNAEERSAKGHPDLLDEIKLRYYQNECVDNTLRMLDNNPLFLMPTGTGKTVCFAEMARRLERVLVMAHRERLVTQAAGKIEKFTGARPQIEMAELSADPCSAGNVVCSVQSMKNRLHKYSPNRFRAAIVDEAHHGVAKTYEDILEYFNCPRIGCTATPDRADEKSLKKVFGVVSYQYELFKAVLDGYLVKIKGRKSDLNLDLSGLRKLKGDVHPKDLEDLIITKIEPIARAIVDELKDRKMILVFMPGVTSSKLMAERLTMLGMKSRSVTGDTRDRVDIFEDFQEGSLRCLVGCDVFTEGYDEPGIDAIALCRLTCSRSLYAQMVGRGLRLHPDKTDLLLLEFTANSSKFNLVEPFELFASKEMGDEVRKIARSLPGDDYFEIMRKARAIMDTKITSMVIQKGRFTSFDPWIYGGISSLGLDGELELNWSEESIKKKPTAGQINLLTKVAWFDKDSISRMNRGQAAMLIDDIAEQAGKGNLYGYAKKWHEKKMRELMG